MEIVLALMSALMFALGSVLQQKAGVDAPSPGPGSQLLLRMARRRVWVAGVGADVVGFALQAWALSIGRLAVVQPLLVANVVLALPLGAWLSGLRVRRVDLAAAGLVVAALAGFLAIADPSGGSGEAPLSHWLIAGIACAAACTPLALLGRTGPAARRATFLAAAAGILFALSAALTKAAADELHAGIVHVLTSWEPYALAAVGYVSLTLNQLALNTGALAATVATSTALDPIASVVLGVGLFGEHLRAGRVGTIGAFAALGFALAGMTVLARSEAHGAAAEGAQADRPTPARASG